MQVSQINCYNPRVNSISKSSKVNSSQNPTFKTALYRLAVKEATKGGHIADFSEVEKFFNKLLYAAIRMPGCKIVNKHNVLDNYTNFITKLVNVRTSPKMVILQKNNEPVLRIFDKEIIFTDIEPDPYDGLNAEIEFGLKRTGFTYKIPYDRYDFHFNQVIKTHTHYSSDYNDSDTEHFNELGLPNTFRNIINDIFHL